MSGTIRNYFNSLRNVLDAIPEHKVFDAELNITNAIIAGKNIFTVGNGGSASTASHFICDLVKGSMYEKGIRGFCLCDNTAMVSAYGNDEGIRRVFASQMKAIGVNQGDILIAYSCSGQSQNVIDAMAYAKDRKMYVIAITGHESEPMRQFSNCFISIPSEDTQLLEDAHLAISHCLFRRIREVLNAK